MAIELCTHCQAYSTPDTAQAIPHSVIDDDSWDHEEHRRDRTAPEEYHYSIQKAIEIIDSCAGAKNTDAYCDQVSSATCGQTNNAQIVARRISRQRAPTVDKSTAVIFSTWARAI